MKLTPFALVRMGGDCADCILAIDYGTGAFVGFADRALRSRPKASIPYREERMTKSLDDVKADMSELYEAVKAGNCDLRVAAELTNITGKFLKAAQLEFAKELWVERRTPPAGLIEG